MNFSSKSAQLKQKEGEEKNSVELFRRLLFSRPEQSQGLLYKHLCHSLIHSLCHPLVEIFFSAPPRPNAMVGDGEFSHKINYFPFFKKQNPNLGGHLNRFIGSKVRAILMNGGILPRGGVATGRVCPCSLRSSLSMNMLH